jgi:hypothetical protein
MESRKSSADDITPFIAFTTLVFWVSSPGVFVHPFITGNRSIFILLEKAVALDLAAEAVGAKVITLVGAGKSNVELISPPTRKGRVCTMPLTVVVRYPIVGWARTIEPVDELRLDPVEDPELIPVEVGVIDSIGVLDGRATLVEVLEVP